MSLLRELHQSIQSIEEGKNYGSLLESSALYSQVKDRLDKTEDALLRLSFIFDEDTGFAKNLKKINADMKHYDSICKKIQDLHSEILDFQMSTGIQIEALEDRDDDARRNGADSRAEQDHDD